VVRVVAADFAGASLGSGTLVDANDEHGLVITNWHVVRDAPGNVIVVFPDGFQSLGRVLRMDANWDLAAILINKPRAAPVRLAAKAPQIGETLTIAGYGGGSYRAVSGPCTQYLSPSVQHPQELVELAASARQGDSGGPIFNGRGELAGVLFGEGGGRTTGAYCGRVHDFLAAAVKQLYASDRNALASQTAPPSDQQANLLGATAPKPGVAQIANAAGANSAAIAASEY
jgi:serine protease Do